MLSCGEVPKTYTDLTYQVLNGVIQKSKWEREDSLVAWVQKSGPGPEQYGHRQLEPLKLSLSNQRNCYSVAWLGVGCM